MTPAERLRGLAAQMLELADAMDNAAPPMAEGPATARSALVPLCQAARELGMTYDAVRKAPNAQSETRMSLVKATFGGIGLTIVCPMCPSACRTSKLVSDDSPAS